jgi:CDP-glucose 4,6-dehydratase
MGTANLLDAFFRLESPKLFMGITTDKVYKNDNLSRKFLESDPLAGKDPYSASKVGAESALAAWQQISKIQGGPTVVSVRAGNVIGGGDFAQDRIIPDIVRGVIGNEKILIRNPKNTRPWQHVLDPLYGYLLAANKAIIDKLPESYNFGPDGESLSVGQLAEIAKSIWSNRKIDLMHGSGEESSEAKTLALNSSKAHKELDWKPVWTQENAIADTFKWWKRVADDKTAALDACEYDLETLTKAKNDIN